MKILKHTKNFSNIYKSSSVAKNCFKSSASNKFITHFNITNNTSLLFTQFSKRNYGAGLGIISWNDDYDTDKPIDPNFPQDQYFDKLRTFKEAQKETNEESDEEVTSEDEDDAGESELTLPNHDTPLEVQQYMKDIAVAFPYREIISVSKHCKVTPAGRVFSFSSFILVGNNNGSAGYGYGRGASAKEATEKAFYDSHKHILTINRDKQNCLIATRVVKFKTCKVTIYPQRRGNNGLVGSSIVQKIYNAFGIQGGSNIRFLKKPRTKNKKTMVKALFKLLEDIKNPQEISAQVGRQYFDPDTIFRRKYFKHIY